MRTSRRQFQKDDGTKCVLLFSATLHTNIVKLEKEAARSQEGSLWIGRLDTATYPVCWRQSYESQLVFCATHMHL